MLKIIVITLQLIVLGNEGEPLQVLKIDEPTMKACQEDANAFLNHGITRQQHEHGAARIGAGCTTNEQAPEES